MSAHLQRMKQLTEASIEEGDVPQEADAKMQQAAAGLAANASHADFVAALSAAKEAEKAATALAANASHANQNETPVDPTPAVGGNPPPLVLGPRVADTAPQQARRADEVTNDGGKR